MFLFTTVEVVVIKDEKIFDVYFCYQKNFCVNFLGSSTLSTFYEAFFIRWDHPPKFINIKVLDVFKKYNK